MVVVDYLIGKTHIDSVKIRREKLLPEIKEIEEW
jgi:hypothetical protein